jgi:thiol-disulfide isomerase/thioredoxin
MQTESFVDGAYNHLRVPTERDAMNYIARERNNVLYVVRFYSDDCPACIASNEPFRRLARAHPDVIFFTIDVQGLGVPTFFSGVRYTPSYTVATKYAGQIAFMEAPDLAELEAKIKEYTPEVQYS